MKLRSFSLIMLANGILLLIAGTAAPLIALHNCISANSAVGIIGGADTPTYQLIVMSVMNGWPMCFLLFGAAFVISALFCLIFSKTVKTYCTLSTAVISLGLSAVGAMGVVCVFVWYTIVVFHEMSKHPIEYPLSISLGMACMLLFIALITLYFCLRRKCWSVIGFVIDVFTGILYLPAFLSAFLYMR